MKCKAITSAVLFVLSFVILFHFGASLEAADSPRNSGVSGVQMLMNWWSMFHHDLSHTGFSPSTAPETNHTSWTSRPGGGFEWSSAAIVDDVVYVGSSDGYVYSLNASTGTVIWNASTGGIVESSPGVVDGSVYVGSYDSRVYALNASTGRQMWNYTTGGDVLSSPAVAGGMVFVGSCDYSVYALNASTGVRVWRYQTDDQVLSSAAVVNGTVFVGSMDGTFYAFGPENVVPEFPSYLVLPSFMVVTLLAVFVFRGKRPKDFGK
jgi:outer membrane protein assembly factor BamB